MARQGSIEDGMRRTNRAMTLFTSLGPSADCRGLTQVPTYQVRISHVRGAAFAVSPRGFSPSWGLQGKVARTPHQRKGSGGTVCAGALHVVLVHFRVRKRRVKEWLKD